MFAWAFGAMPWCWFGSWPMSIEQMAVEWGETFADRLLESWEVRVAFLKQL